MKVNHYEAIDEQPVQMQGAEGCTVRQLVSRSDGAPNFAMRQFTVAPGGHTPRHFHPYEHEIFVLAGDGEIWEGDTPHPLRAGDVILVKPDEVHQFRNTGNTPFKFLCMIPNSAMDKTVTVVPECGREESP